MYSASADFNTAIKANTRKITWAGSIVTTGGNTYTLNQKSFFRGSISRSISGQSLKIGSVYSSSLSMELIIPGVSRYDLYGATITITCSIEGALDVIPMGIYYISEALQAADHITIKAYDAMLKFDEVAFVATANTSIQKPYDWLSDMCTACGVTLGSTSAEIGILPNGNRKTGFADTVADVDTWRDVLSYLGAYLGAYAYIGRNGYLHIGQYKAASDDTIPPLFRYESDLSDFRTTYDGLYAIYKADGVQEYVSNLNSGGLVLDLGVNPFLQFSDAANRTAALQEIIDAWNGIYYVPYSAQLPLVPIYDPGDVLTFTGNQAGVYDVGVITAITYAIEETMSVKCSGDNPKLSAAQDRFSKTVAGLSAEYNNGQETGGKNFWLLHTENTSSITLDNYYYTKVAEIEWDQSVDVMRLGMMFTCEVDRSSTGTVNLLLTVDGTDSDPSAYNFEVIEQKSSAGKRIHSVPCAFRVTGKGKHSARVFILNMDNPLRWSELI